MILGRVLGEVWASRRDPGLGGRKLLLVQPHHWYEPPFQSGHLVAVDRIGAGPGEDVIVCLGEPARQSLLEDSNAARALAAGPGYAQAAWLPVDAAVMAIVDRIELSAGDLVRPLRSLCARSASAEAGGRSSPGGQR